MTMIRCIDVDIIQLFQFNICRLFADELRLNKSEDGCVDASNCDQELIEFAASCCLVIFKENIKLANSKVSRLQT